MHELICKPREKRSTLFQCTCDNCGKSFESETGLQTHIYRYHEWHARKCTTPGCSDKVFTNQRAWAHHLNAKHNPLETPKLCSVDGCKSAIVWKSYYSYTSHLRNVHKLVTAADRQPYFSEHQGTSHWPAGQCPIGGMKNCEITFKARSNLMRHLTAGAHQLSNEDASNIANRVKSQMSVLVDYEMSGEEEMVSKRREKHYVLQRHLIAVQI